MLTVAFSESTMNRTQVQLWYNQFKEDREDFNDDAPPGHTSTTATEEKIVLMSDLGSLFGPLFN